MQVGNREFDTPSYTVNVNKGTFRRVLLSRQPVVYAQRHQFTRCPSCSFILE